MHPAIAGLLTVLFPQENACHLCGRSAQFGVLCSRCYEQLGQQELPLNMRCLSRADDLRASIACWRHRGVARRLVHHLKYSTDPRAAIVLAEGMLRALHTEEMDSCIDLIVPVPLHAEREKKRGYNQAALLAQELSTGSGIAMRQDVLFRTRFTDTLVDLDRKGRLQMMRGAFAVANPAVIAQKRILLVDDVFTTGATAQACAEALKGAAAAEVYVITACRA